MKRLAGKVALITGASWGGTGAAMAVRFAHEGARLALVARNHAGLQKTADLAREAGSEAIVLPCDLGDNGGGRETLIARTEEALGSIDILVNNAVKNDIKRFGDYSLEDMRSDGEVNLWGPMQLVQQATRSMREGQRRGWILNMSSMGAELPPGPPFDGLKLSYQSALYAAMKGGLNAFSIYFAVEMLRYGICVNTLSPQRSILTERMRTSKIVKDKSICEPLGTMAQAALELCSGAPHHLNGRLAFSLQLLVELGVPVYDLDGRTLLEGWQPADLVKAIQYREDWTKQHMNWSHPYEFHRPQTPYPEVLRRG